MAATSPERHYRRLVERLEEDLGISTAELADATGVSLGTVERWKGGALPQGEALTRLSALVQIQNRLDETFSTTEAARSWLWRPNEYLKGGLPIDAIRAGRPQRVDNALEVINSGVYL